MIYSTTELDEMPEVDSYQKEPTWVDTFKASTKNFTSVSLSHSRDDYYKSEMKNNTTEWSKKDPNNKDLYDRISNYAYKDMEQLEALYDEGNIDAIRSYRQVNPFNADMFLAEDFLRYKEISGQQGLKPISEIRNDINTRAVKDFEESSQAIAQSDSLSAELAGTMYGALHDIKTLQTLPLGTWKTGGTVLSNAGRGLAEEMGIEALAQISIAPEVYSFKKELGLKTSIATEAYNAAMAIGTAGLVRGTGSAMFDLSEKGIKALKVKNPGLGEDYEALAKTQPTQDMKTHIDNMQKVEFSGEPLEEIKTPNAKGVELNEAKAISEIDEEVVEVAKKGYLARKAAERKAGEAKPKGETRYHPGRDKNYIYDKDADIIYFQTPNGKWKEMPNAKLRSDIKYIDEDMKIVTGKDLDGNIETRSYKEINAEYDENDIMFKKIQDCILGVG